MKLDVEALRNLFGKATEVVMQWLPNLLGAIVLLLVGWIIATVTKFILRSVLQRFGVDKLAERTGIASIMTSWGITSTLSRLISRFVYWVILLIFLLGATESLGLNIVAGTLKSFVDFLPRLFAAALIILLGGFVAGISGDALTVYAKKARLQTGAYLGLMVKYTIFLIVIIVALEQLGIETILLTGIILTAVIGLILALAIAFGLGNRELARNITAGFHARDSFIPGAMIKLQKYSGKLIRIGTFRFTVETESEEISLPNHLLTDEEVIIMRTDKKNEEAH